MTAADYSLLSKNFDPTLAKIAEVMDASGLDWFVVAGWAMDLFIGKKTREHKDIEISIWRDQIPLLFERFSQNQIDMVIGHKRYEILNKDSVVDKRGHLILREVSVGGETLDIELFTTERKNGHWLFRKQNEVQAPLNEAVLTSAMGPKYLAPQFVLLYKAWFFPTMDQAIKDMPTEADFLRKCWSTDCSDFDSASPLLSKTQSAQLKELLHKFTPGIPWLGHFS
jgi:hypothetical protein